MRLPIVTVIAGAMLAACQPAAPRVDSAWVRLPAVTGRPGAAYFTVTGGRDATSLVSVRTPAAVRVELHESMTGAGGMTGMAPLNDVAVPAGQPLVFAPGARHAMLFDMNPTLKAGGETTLTLAFADGKTIETEARLLGAGDPAP